MAKSLFPETPKSHAYRGYYCQYNPMTRQWSIAKDGYHIGYAADETEAHKIIDTLVQNSLGYTLRVIHSEGIFSTCP